MHNIKDGNLVPSEQLGETIENYKLQLEKYDQILASEGRCDRAVLFSEAVMKEHIQKLHEALKNKNTRGVIEVLLSLRVNALQISPELRKNLVYELIRNDIFCLNSPKQDSLLLELLNKDNPPLLHASISLVSVVVSTLKGVIYLMSNGKNVLL